jgi:hypothetical protein
VHPRRATFEEGCVTLPWAALWRSDLEWLAHLVGIIGFALIIASMVYSLRKRKWLIKAGKISKWLSLHHWAGFLGGVLAIVHTLGNFRGLGVPITAVLVLVLASSGIYLVERRTRRPLDVAAAELAKVRKERGRLDGEYKQMYAWGQAGSPKGVETYNALLAQIEAVKRQEAEVGKVKAKVPKLAWWRHVHNVGTMVMVGFLVVHIWSKLYFAWGGL